jgi:hypothetical protein
MAIGAFVALFASLALTDGVPMLAWSSTRYLATPTVTAALTFFCSCFDNLTPARFGASIEPKAILTEALGSSHLATGLTLLFVAPEVHAASLVVPLPA